MRVFYRKDEVVEREEFLIGLGEISTTLRVPRATLVRRLRQYGVRLSHWGRGPRAPVYLARAHGQLLWRRLFGLI